MRKIVMISCLVVLLVSCSKKFLEPNDTDDLIPADPVLSRILVDNKPSTVFDYDAQGRLVKTTIYSSPGSGIIGSEAVRRYNDAGQLIKIENAVNISSSSTAPQYDQSYSELTYDAKGFKEMKTYRLVSGAAQYVSRSVPGFDGDGKMISMTVYDPSGAAVNKSTYAYFQNNVILEEFYQYNSGLTSPTMQKIYEYDQNKNPYFGHWIMPYGANFNNITKVISTNNLAVPVATVTTLTTFKTYTNSRYPALVNENGVDYTYEYK